MQVGGHLMGICRRREDVGGGKMKEEGRYWSICICICIYVGAHRRREYVEVTRCGTREDVDRRKM